jgi:hypothetical protein
MPLAATKRVQAGVNASMLGLMFLAGIARAQDIRVQATMEYWSCSAVASAGTPVRLYVLGTPSYYGGMTAAELRIEGIPPGWQATATPNPAASYTAGDPLGDGAQIAFSECVIPGPGGSVLLYTLELTHAGDTGMYELVAVGPRNPGNPNFACPTVYLCDAPVFTRLCASNRRFYMNTSPSQTANPARLVQPEDGATGVELDMQLLWSSAENRDCFNHPFPRQCVLFGTAGNVEQVACNEEYPWNSFRPGLLQPYTTYSWRIETSPSITSPTWSFTTGPSVEVDSRSWSAVKYLFR